MSRLRIFLIAAVLALVLVGCQRNGAGSASADIRYRVFEAPVETVDKVAPREQRTQIGASGYWAAHVSSTQIESLLASISAKPGLLVDHSRRISWWPRIADTWAYSRADGKLLGGGGGAGFLGVRCKDDAREIRIEYDVTHTINTRKPIQSKVTYEGPAPDEGIVLIRPFERRDGTKLVHVLAFEIDNWK